MPAQSRTTLWINQFDPGLIGRSFRIDVATVGTPLPLVVERATCRTQNGEIWSSGSATLGVPRR